MDQYGIDVKVDDLAAAAINARARSEVVDAIAQKVIEKYGEDFMEKVSASITFKEVRALVLNKMADKIIEHWRNDG